MVAVHDLLERGIPDLIDTTGLPPLLAAEIDVLAGRADRVLAAGRVVDRARAAVLAGDASLAQELVGSIDPPRLSVSEAAGAAWVVSRVGPPALATPLLERLRHEPSMLSEGDVPLGPRSLCEGLLFAAAGRLADADDRLRGAVADGDARAPLWGALARTERARVVRCRLAVDAHESSSDLATLRRLEQSAQLFFRAGGYVSLGRRAAASADTDPDTAGPGAPCIGWMLPGASWTVGFGVMAPVPVRASKGLVALHHLIAHPDQPVPSVVLDVVASGDDPASALADRLDDPSALVTDEAARTRVQKLLHRTRDRLAEVHPVLGAHLRATITTGHVCRYRPPSEPRLGWRMRD